MKEIDRMRVLSGIEPLRAREEQINEGWLQNLAAAVGLLAATSGAAQTIKDLPYDKETLNKIEVALENPQVINKLKEMGVEDNNIERAIKRFVDNKHKVDGIKVKKVVGDEELAKYLKMGYHLTSVETDTIVKLIPTIAPKSVVEETVINFNDNSFFSSGEFTLDDSGVQEIRDVLDSINTSEGVLLGVIIESSTDKQGLSTNLQKKLLSLGYSRDNKGLSQARSNAVMQVLESQGIDSSLIEQKVLFERGEGIINPIARYVRIRMQVLQVEVTPVNPEINSPIIEYPQTFEVIKAIAKKKKYFRGVPGNKTCKVSIIKFKKGQILCPVF